MAEADSDCKHTVRSSQPYSCLSEFRNDKLMVSDRILDIHSIGVILTEILVGTDVILSCGCWEAVDDLITLCEDYMDKETTNLLHQLIRFSNDNGIGKYYREVLIAQPEVIGENIRAMDYAVTENRILINKKESTTNLILT